MTARSSTVLLPALFLFAAIASADDSRSGKATATTFAVGPNGELALQLPQAWAPTIKTFEAKQEGSAGLSLKFQSAEPSSWAVLLSGFWNYAAPPKLSADELKNRVVGLRDQYADQTVDKSEIREIRGDGVIGYYVSVSDKKPKATEYAYMSQGVARVGELTIAFTVLSNGDREPTLGKTLSMLSTAKFARL